MKQIIKKWNTLTWLLALIMISNNLFAQVTSTFRAQGYYYKAKELYTAGKYSEAIPYLDKTKEALGNSTNDRTQYLYIKCCIGLKDWSKAKKELDIYANILDNKIKAIYFTHDVERLTNDEQTDLSKEMVTIEENETFSNSPEGKRKKLKDEIIELLDELFYQKYNRSTETTTTSETFTYNSSFMFCEYKITGTWKSPVKYCYDQEDVTQSVDFSIMDIESVNKISNEWSTNYLIGCSKEAKYPKGDFFYIHLKNKKTQFGKVDGYKGIIFNAPAKPISGYDWKKSCDKEILQIAIRVKNDNPDKLKRLNELLAKL